jgi:hypothetical protein
MRTRFAIRFVACFFNDHGFVRVTRANGELPRLTVILP